MHPTCSTRDMRSTSVQNPPWYVSPYFIHKITCPPPNSGVDLSQKRKRIAAREQRASEEMVKRSKLLSHPLGGAVGLLREASAPLASTRKILNQRGEACAHLFRRKTLLDVEYHWKRFPVLKFVREAPSGNLFVGGWCAGLDHCRPF